MDHFTAARAEQHRAELMSAARHARDLRLAKAGRRRAGRLRLPRITRHQSANLPAPVLAPATH